MAETDYKSTLKLPRTDFPMKANLPKREPEMLKHWDEAGLYQRLMEARKDAQLWVLHDGPPYANGRVHLGTALNKILKDFVVRSRSMMGYRTPFVPGWDCHGMPIEHKVSRELGDQARTISKLELRKLCRAEAEKWIDLQRSDFRRLGVIGDWFKPYLTMAPEYDAAEIGVLRKMVERGYVYRGLRPVHWCFDCRTALAEAEVEYREHVSPSIYVAFAFNSNLKDAGALAADRIDGAELDAAHKAGKLSAVIWTTTPWTLPANLGISLNETFDYVALKAGEHYYVVASRLADNVAKECGLAVEKRIALSGDALKALDGQDIFRHPFIPRDVKLMYAEHVTADAGTGLVHTAPGHGYEDFVVGKAYGLTPFTPVDGGGVFTAEGGDWAGQNVFKANKSIVERLAAAGALLHAQNFSHSYPHCWRCHNPLIFLATEQWFVSIDHNELRVKVIDAIDKVKWYPGWSRDRIRNMTETRPDWCISRQRAWGVPIPAVKCAKCDEVAPLLATMDRVEEIFAREGSDAWYSRPAANFVAPGLKCQRCGGADFVKQEDILDVWFDSGSSQAAVLGARPELAWPADAYLEAVEQARGWFGSSLVCAVSERGAAPFKSVISHGLTVDERGRKMSKSLGNSEDAVDAVGRMGADVLRLVYASLDYTADIALGQTIFSAVSESYRKIRNTCRFVLGNLADFDPARDAVEISDMLEFDRYILAVFSQVSEVVRHCYEEFDFQTAYRTLSQFIVVDLSATYVDVARDRLYCSAEKSLERRSAQTALFTILDALVRMLAPLIPFTAEEVYSYLPGKKELSVHLLTLNDLSSWNDTKLVSQWAPLLRIRDEALKLLEAMRKAGTIGAPLDAAISLGADAGSESALAETIKQYREVLKDLFIVSEVAILGDAEAAEIRSQAGGREDFAVDGSFARATANPAITLVGRHASGVKCARCWKYFDEGGDHQLDARCRAVVGA
ncbi:isoleucine--tRNA ligase [Candidatus Binatus sp.]|uniref:isoleucine--tRNA ligase n=1 Tax=Candidatus Binatus sp. TaxID=2811406 RepID=UPI003F99B5F1